VKWQDQLTKPEAARQQEPKNNALKQQYDVDAKAE